MEYRKLPHGDEMIGVVGIGTGGIHEAGEAEAEAIFNRAIDGGINYFDMCAGHRSVYRAFGRAIAGRREKVFFQLHFGAVYNEKDEYGWDVSNLERIKELFEWELAEIGTDYADFGFLHCLDEEKDYQKMLDNGVFDYIKGLKAAGKVRHIGFSSHTPSVANKILDSGVIDMMMFSLNPAYDFAAANDPLGRGAVDERAALFRRCESEGVGISVMKPFHAGKLLDAEKSPFGKALSQYQCIQYALDRPGVMCVLPGVQSTAQLETLLGFADAPAEEKDYSEIGDFTAETVRGSCVYCRHCQPCPVGIDIGLVNKYYDLAKMGDKLAADHYRKLEVKAGACVGCGHCTSRCPFGVDQQSRMAEIAEYFGE